MSAATVSIEELDLVVLGQVQYDFVLNGTNGYSLSSVLTPCCAARAVALEDEVSMLSEVVRKRSKKLEDLGNALADVAYIISAIDAAGNDTPETSVYPKDAAKGQKEVEVSHLAKLVDSYDLTYTDKDNNVNNVDDLLKNEDGTYKTSIVKNDAEIVQSAVKLAVDKENNAVKQDCNTLQGIVDKRDDAYELIGKLEDKINNTAKTAISAMGS